MSASPQEEREETLLEELRESQEALQAFAYAVSHDLGAPLRSQTGFSEILQQKYAAQLDEKGKSYLRFINEGSRKAQAMLQGLLTYSRVYSQSEPPEEIDITGLARRLFQELRDKKKEQQVELEIEEGLNCRGDTKQIESLIEILLENAFLYKSPLTPLRIQIRGEETEKAWLFEIEDNGIGIPEESRKKIFGIFKRLHTEEAYPGLGMGLAIATRIAERHKGKLTAREAPKNGSIFTLTLSKTPPQTLE